MTERWDIWIDRGGTFTDALGRRPGTDEVLTAKVPSSDRAPLEAVRALLGLGPDAPIPPCDIRMGTTVATNALLERAGARCAVVLTEGFEDLLRIGTQARPDLFALDIEKTPPLYERVVVTNARATPRGEVLARPDRAALRAQLEEAKAAGIESVAVCVMGGFAAPQLEAEVATVVDELGFGTVVPAHRAAAGIGLLGRSETAVVDAYLTPLLTRYLDALSDELHGSRLFLMQSGGGLCAPERFRGPGAILSGPAGGVVAAQRLAVGAGYRRALGFDMGGTSTDVSRFDDHGVARRHEVVIDGVRIRAPMVDIHTVAAGGGSLCRYDGEQLTVGPASAGADPGPLCYGKPHAAHVAVTDLNVVTGRLPADRFPFPLDAPRARRALEAIGEQVGAGGLVGTAGVPTAEEVAEGFLAVANAHMAEAIRTVSVARGYDATEHALVVFGGAGGQHACALARRLGIKTVLVHPWAGVLSAWGMGLAPTVVSSELDGGRVALDDDVLVGFAATADALVNEATRTLEDEGVSPEVDVVVERWLALRYRGSDTALEVLWSPGMGAEGLRVAFEARHERQLGYRRPGAVVEVHAVRQTVSAPGAGATAPTWTTGAPGKPLRSQRVFFDGRTLDDVPIYGREALVVDQRVSGPAIVLDDTGAVWLEPGFSAVVADDGTLVITAGELTRACSSSIEKDPVRLVLFSGAFSSIAEQMGEALRRTAQSVNIKERLDFSCALFDAEGQLVANAPHIPVHLGAMAETVKAVRRAHPSPKPGDAFVSNDPAAGGSHLPDITVVTPVFDDDGVLRFFTASRGHHSDVGGITPGSMPPFATALDEEGVVFRAVPMTRGGEIDEAALREVLGSGAHPARDPEQNLADLGAQLAANHTGARLLLELAATQGVSVVEAYMRHVQSHASAAVRRAIAGMPDGQRRFDDALDDGTPVVVTLTINGERMRIDFSGTGDAQPSNLNAPRAVTMAAVLYAVRVLAGEELPLCSGCLEPIDVVIPPGSLLDPEPERAVSGGNVETSQRVVDVLIGAMGLAAASQGTMNNLTLGNDRFGYYETIAGGAGATRTAPGASGVQVHMTNTRITDPEVLEERYPLRLVRFGLRHGSGGEGAHRGGDGVVRTLRALEPLEGAIVSQRRTRRPFGLEGGGDGQPGRNLVRGELVPSSARFTLEVGEEVSVQTPGGGGFGAPEGR